MLSCSADNKPCFHAVLSSAIVAVHVCRRSDYEVGEELLRKYVFIHLSEAADKLQLMLAMLHKLYALVSWSAARLRVEGPGFGHLG